MGGSASKAQPSVALPLPTSGCSETPALISVYLTAVFLRTLVAAGLAQVDRPVVVIVLLHSFVDNVVCKLFFLRSLALHLQDGEGSHLPSSEVVDFRLIAEVGGERGGGVLLGGWWRRKGGCRSLSGHLAQAVALRVTCTYAPPQSFFLGEPLL